MATDSGTDDEDDRIQGPGGSIALLNDAVDAFDGNGDGIHGMVLTGRVGFHAFYSSDPDDSLAAAADAALFAGLWAAFEEFHVDSHTVERNQGEVTPQSIAAEIGEELGRYGLSPYAVETTVSKAEEFLVDEQEHREADREQTGEGET